MGCTSSISLPLPPPERLKLASYYRDSYGRVFYCSYTDCSIDMKISLQLIPSFAAGVDLGALHWHEVREVKPPAFIAFSPSPALLRAIEVPRVVGVKCDAKMSDEKWYSCRIVEVYSEIAAKDLSSYSPLQVQAILAENFAVERLDTGEKRMLPLYTEKIAPFGAMSIQPPAYEN